MSEKTTLLDILMDAVCSVMLADGIVADKERNAIHIICGKIKAPWSNEEIEHRIDTFVKQVEERSLGAIVKETCERLPRFKKKGIEFAVLRCVDYMAKIDGIIDNKEAEVIKTFRAALDSSPCSPLDKQSNGPSDGSQDSANVGPKKDDGTSKFCERDGEVGTEEVEQAYAKGEEFIPKEKCEVCGQPFGGLPQGTFMSPGADAMGAMFLTMRYICSSCGFTSHFNCCADDSVGKVICKQCGSIMENV